jgi:hypothetical protein
MNQHQNPPTIGSGWQQNKMDEEADVELIHVCMKTAEKPQAQKTDLEMQESTKTTMGFEQRKPDERPPDGHWV